MGKPNEGQIGKSLAEWSVDGELFTLWEADKHFTLDGPNLNIGYRTYYTHDALDVLCKYAEDVLLLKIPLELAEKSHVAVADVQQALENSSNPLS